MLFVNVQELIQKMGLRVLQVGGSSGEVRILKQDKVGTLFRTVKELSHRSQSSKSEHISGVGVCTTTLFTVLRKTSKIRIPFRDAPVGR